MTNLSDPREPVGRSRWTRRRVLAACLGTGGAMAGGFAWSNRPIAPGLPRVSGLGRTSLGFVSTLAFSPDGTTLAAGGARLILHDLSGRDARPLRDDDHETARPATAPREDPEDDGLLTLALAFSPDGATLAAGDHGGLVRLWDVRTGAVVARLEGERRRRVLSLAFSPDGTTLAVAGDDWSVQGWDVARRSLRWSLGRPVSLGPLHAIVPQPLGHVIGFNREGSLLSAVNARGLAPFSVWDTTAQRYRYLCDDEPAAIWPYQVAPDGLSAVAGDPRSVALWDVAGGQKRIELQPPLPDAWGGAGASFHPDGRSLAVPWNARTRAWIAQRNANDQAILAWFGVRPGTRRDVAVHETQTGRLFFLLEGETTSSFSRDGRLLATANAEGRIALWDARPIDEALRA